MSYCCNAQPFVVKFKTELEIKKGTAVTQPVSCVCCTSKCAGNTSLASYVRHVHTASIAPAREGRHSMDKCEVDEEKEGHVVFQNARKTYLNQSTVRDLQLQFGSSCGLKLSLERAKSTDGLLQRHGRPQHHRSERDRGKTATTPKSELNPPNRSTSSLRRHFIVVIYKPFTSILKGFM